jgi:hypothetical protein
LPLGATLTVVIPGDLDRDAFTRGLEFDAYRTLERERRPDGGAIAQELDQIEVSEKGYVDVGGTWISEVTQRTLPDDRVEVTFRVRHHVAFIPIVHRLVLARRFEFKSRGARYRIEPKLPEGDRIDALPLYEAQQPYAAQRDLCDVEVVRSRPDPFPHWLTNEQVTGGVTVIECFDWIRTLRRETTLKRPREDDEEVPAAAANIGEEDRRLLKDKKQRRINDLFKPAAKPPPVAATPPVEKDSQ